MIAALGAACGAFALLAGTAVWLLMPDTTTPRPPSAVIVDQLALTHPNPAFIQSATATLEAAGYEVTYVPQEEVTVDFYRSLPSQRYDFIILRSHSSQSRMQPDGVTEVPQVGLFTNERYDPVKHVAEQIALRLSVGRYPHLPATDRYFVVAPDFVEDAMRGRFDDAVIVLMGCAGLSSDGMAQAFADRGASLFVSWDKDVTAPGTDEATQYFLDRMLRDGLSAEESAAATTAALGPEPFDGGRLAVFGGD